MKDTPASVPQRVNAARDTGRFLRACVTGRSLVGDVEAAAALLPRLDEAATEAALVRHRVAGCAVMTLRAVGGAPPLLPRLEALSRSALARHLRCCVELGLVDAALSGVPYAVVKGPVLAGHAYSRPDMRTYSDLDVLVSPSQLADAIERLDGAGFATLDRNWDMFVRDLPGEVHLRSPLGGMLDLHWHVQNDRKSRERAHIRTSSLLERRRSVTIGEASIPTLDAVDSLLHVCLHAARSGGHRLVWLKDLQQLWLRDQPAADLLLSRAQDWGVELALMLMLQRAQVTLDDPQLAEDVSASLNRTNGRHWGPLFRSVDRLAPVERAGDGSSATRLLARAVAADPPHAAREGLRRAIFGLRQLGVSTSPEMTWDARNPESVVFDSGGARQRAAYFAAVAQLDD